MNCKFWSGRGDDEMGLCRRYAPFAVAHIMVQVVREPPWPPVNRDDWCGEHEPQREAEGEDDGE